MDAQQLKAKRAQRRRRRVRRAIHGTATKPRLSVYRSNFHIYAQLIDDDNAVTLASASTSAKGGRAAKGGNITAATAVGKQIAEAAKAKGITIAAFDRGQYRYHGRVKALARAATEAGLKCTGLEETVKKEAAPVVPAPKPKKEKKPAEAKA